MLYSSLLILLVAVVARTANSLYSKYTLGKIDPIAFYLVTNIICAIGVLPFVYTKFDQLTSLSVIIIACIIGAGAFQAVTGILSNYALKNTPVSVYTILSQLQLVWVIILSIALLGETVNLVGAFGIGLILFASFLTSGSLEIRKEVGLKPIMVVVLSSLVAACAITIDSVLVKTVDPLLYFFLMITIPSFLFVPYILRKNLFHFEKIKRHWVVYLVASALFGATYFSLLLLYTLPDVPISVSYSIRNTSGIFAVALAVFIFGENKNIPRKILATIIAIVGAVIVKLA